jgi:hypothetical protein
MNPTAKATRGYAMTSALPQSVEAGSAVAPRLLSCFLCGKGIRALASVSTRDFLAKLKRNEVAFLTCAECFGEVCAEMAKRRTGLSD